MSLVVVYDQGAVSPTEIVQAIGATRTLIAVVAPSGHAQRFRPLFAETCAAVYDLAEKNLLDLLRGHDLEGVVTFSEQMLSATSGIAAALGLTHHDVEVVERLTNKSVQRRELRAAGVDATASRILSRADDWDSVVREVGLPVVVKPVHGVSSRNTVLIEDAATGRAEIEHLLAEERLLVAEEYLRGMAVPDPYGDYVSVETVVQQGEQCHLAITGKLRLVPPFRECGQFWPARLDAGLHDSVLQLTGQAVKALGVTDGVLHTEIKLTPDGPRIIEVNGRAGGYIPELARRAASVDLVDVAAKIATGRHVDLAPAELDRVFFQFTTPAPIESGTVAATCDRKAAMGIPGVTGYHPFMRPGAEVGGIRTHDLDLVVGEVPDHEALVSVTVKILDGIGYRFDFGDRQVSRTARDLVYPEVVRSSLGE